VPSPVLGLHVFVNCPFDQDYKPMFEAIVFAIHDLFFVPRCALEEDDSGAVRYHKIERIIEQCRFGVHDLSAVELDPNTRLPRFNMPLELGLFLGCKRFGGPGQREKVSLILDSDRYRYRQFLSDLSGQDIHAHGGKPEQAIREVRNWLCAASGKKSMPGGAEIFRRYTEFRGDLPRSCAQAKVEPGEMTFSDFSEMIAKWLQSRR
jgi:hypothetical protein